MDTNYDDDLLLSPQEKVSLGEVMNISMGAAAAAATQLLANPVEITVSEMEAQELADIRYEQYEPALLVNIGYTTGITGSNMMVFRQYDMQLVLNMLMGISGPPSDDFVFNELSISSVGEAVNQMMGASATALSEVVGKTVGISSPTIMVMEDDNTILEAMDPEVVAVTFKFIIRDVLESEFISILNIELVKEIVPQLLWNGEVSRPEASVITAPADVPASPHPAADVPAATSDAEVCSPQPESAQQPCALVPDAPNTNVRPGAFSGFAQPVYADGVPVMGNNLDLIITEEYRKHECGRGQYHDETKFDDITSEDKYRANMI